MARTAIVICGDAGPARHVLLARREIRLFWADSLRDARATLKASTPALVIMRPKLRGGTARELLEIARANGAPPCLVLMKRSEWKDRGKMLEAGAVDVLEHDRADTLLEEVSRHTGLMFAKHRRVEVKAPAEVRLPGAGRTYKVEVRDLSVTGIGVAGMGPQEPETLVKVTMLFDGRPQTLYGRITRCWMERKDPMAGVRFIGLSQEERAELGAVVESRESMAPPQRSLLDTLFDDIDVDDSPPPAVMSSDLGFKSARNVKSTTLGRESVPVKPGSPMAGSIQKIADEARTAHDTEPPASLAEHARRALEDLDELGAEGTGDVLAELSEARASILREYLETGNS